MKRIHKSACTSLLRSSGGASLCRQAWATLRTCSNLRGCSSILAARKRQHGARCYETVQMNTIKLIAKGLALTLLQV